MGLNNWVTGCKILSTTTSKHNGEIVVTEDKQKVRRVMCGGPTQSITYDSNKVDGLFWGKAMEYLESNSIVPKNVLILGFCAGTMAHLLSRRFDNIAITGVEIDKEMIAIGEKYFETNRISNLKIEIADAYTYMKKTKEKFDFIMADTYLGAEFAPTLSSTEFLEHIKNGLTDGGIYMVNMLNTSESGNMADNYEKYMHRVFTKVERVNVKGMTASDNVLLIGKVK